MAPSNGIPSTKRVLIRTHRGEAEVLDFGDDDQPEWRGPIFFSSPEVAWSWSQDDTDAVLLRSGDTGMTWQRVSAIPQGGNRRLDLYVDEQRGLAVALLVYEGRGSFGTPGPFVYRSTRLVTDDWQQVDVPLPGFLEPVWFGLGARGGRIEVPRRWPGLEIYDVTDEVVATPVEVDETFQPSEYATFMDRGWIGGSAARSCPSRQTPSCPRCSRPATPIRGGSCRSTASRRDGSPCWTLPLPSRASLAAPTIRR